MRENRLRDVEGETTNEDDQERSPCKIFDEATEKRFVLATEAEECQSEVADGGEDDDNGEQNAETGRVHAVVVDG